MGIVRLYSYALKTSLQKWPIRKGLLLQWNEGWGEIAPLPGFNPEGFEEALAEIVSLLPDLSLAKAKLPSVRFAIESASKPFSLKPLKVPLSLLNVPRPGFSTLKLKLGHLSPKEGIALVKKYHRLYRLRLDCNRSWTLDQALTVASHFQPEDLEYLEEPVQKFSDLVKFSELSAFPVAIDESFGKCPIFEIPTLKTAVIKPTRIGTIPSLFLPIVLSSSFESSVGLLQIARQHAGCAPIGLDTFRYFDEDLLIPPLKAEDGFLTWSPTGAFPIDFSKLCLIASK